MHKASSKSLEGQSIARFYVYGLCYIYEGYYNIVEFIKDRAYITFLVSTDTTQRLVGDNFFK